MDDIVVQKSSVSILIHGSYNLGWRLFTGPKIVFLSLIKIQKFKVLSKNESGA